MTRTKIVTLCGSSLLHLQQRRKAIQESRGDIQSRRRMRRPDGGCPWQHACAAHAGPGGRAHEDAPMPGDTARPELAAPQAPTQPPAAAPRRPSAAAAAVVTAAAGPGAAVGGACRCCRRPGREIASVPGIFFRAPCPRNSEDHLPPRHRLQQGPGRGRRPLNRSTDCLR